MIVKLETERFILREFIDADANGIYLLDSNPNVHKYLGNKPIKTIDTARKIIQNVKIQYKNNGIGRWAIIDKKTNEFVGWSGLKLEKDINNRETYIDLGYRLRQEFWNKGIATETAIEVLKYGFSVLNMTQICAAAHIDNIASNKVLSNIGFDCIEQFNFEGIPHNWYEINKINWVKNVHA